MGKSNYEPTDILYSEAIKYQEKLDRKYSSLKLKFKVSIIVLIISAIATVVAYLWENGYFNVN